MGNPAKDEDQLGFEKLANNTFDTYADYDASPSKAWIIQHKHQNQYKIYYDYAFAKRPAEELYVLAEDPFQVNNVAELPKYDKVRISLRNKLLTELMDTGDPRVTGDGSTFDKPPYAGPYE